MILTRAYKQSLSFVHGANEALTSTASSHSGLAKDIVNKIKPLCHFFLLNFVVDNVS